MKRTFRTLLLLQLLATLLLANKLSATTYYVDTAAQFNSLKDKSGRSFSTLLSGDRVYMKGGNWDGLTNTITGSMTDADAQTNPAIIYSCDGNYVPMIGGVIVTNLSSITLAGQGVTIAGLTFGPTSGMYAPDTNSDYAGNSGDLLSTDYNSRYMTISHIKFDYCGRDNTSPYNHHYGPWIYVAGGYHHTIQYCEFQGRDFNTNDIKQTNPYLRTSIRDATIKLYKGTNSGQDVTDFGHHTIRYNYFGQRLIPLGNDTNLYVPSSGAGSMGNGWETIRIGVGALCTNNMATTVEFNSFYHATYSAYGGPDDSSGEPEMISIKSRGDTIRYNTILNNYSGICFRESDYSLIQGNCFLGSGAYDASGNIVFTDPHNNRMGGVRFYGYGNSLLNNYFFNLTGVTTHGALGVGEGWNDPVSYPLVLEGVALPYKTAVRSQIYGNTFLNCTSLDLDMNSDSTLTNRPYGTQFYNNLVAYSSNIAAAGIISDNSYALSNFGGSSHGAYVYSSVSSQLGAASSILGISGNTIATNAAADPLVTGIYNALTIVPASNSPVLGIGSSLPLITDTSSLSSSYQLASTIGSYSALDIRGLARPSTNSDIGSYQTSASGYGIRPLHRYEVGCVTNTFSPLLLPSSKASVALTVSSQNYTGSIIPLTFTTTPLDLPVTYTVNGSTGNPSAPGSYSVTSAITDPLYSGSGSGTFQIVVAPTVTGNLNLVGIVGTPLSYFITAAGNPVSYSATGLPPGLSVDSGTGLIYGTPATNGVFSTIISAVNSLGAIGSATLTINLATNLTNLTFTNTSTTSWICPANVTSIQVQCWGGGGAGGSAQKISANAYGGGGAGGSYAKVNSYAVTPGNTYIINVGSGGVAVPANVVVNGASVSGGDSWINISNSPSTIIIAKGGNGGACAVGTNNSIYGIGGIGSTNGSIGDTLFKGGNGAQGNNGTFAGAGGASAGTATNGTAATPNSGIGATNVQGGGNGGNPNPVSGSSGAGQSPNLSPGGGGGGAREASISSLPGGNGAPGQVILTVNTLSPAVTPATITISNTNQIYNGMAEPVTYTVSPTNALPVLITYSNALYPTSTNAPTNAGVFAVSASVVNSNFSGSNNATLTISPLTPVITISSTYWPYNGTPRPVSTSISPQGIPVSVTYAGSTSAPSAVGSYPVLASNAASSNWNSSLTSGTLVIYDPVASWRSNYFGTVNNAGVAADASSPYGIGLNNLQAYTFGVDPTQPLTGPLLSISNTGGNTLSLSFLARAAGSGPGYSGLTRYYNLESSTNLTNSNSWSPLPGYSNIPGSNQVISFSTNTSSGPKWFYRLKAWLQ